MISRCPLPIGRPSRISNNHKCPLTDTIYFRDNYRHLPVDTSTFVVSSKQEKILRVFYFVSKHQADCLQGSFPSEMLK